MTNPLPFDGIENDGQNEQRLRDREDALAQREAYEAEFVDQAQEHREFEMGAENMEQYSMRKEAEEMARREYLCDEEHDAWCVENFHANLKHARVLLAERKFDEAERAANNAEAGATSDGQRRLVAALLAAIAKAAGETT